MTMQEFMILLKGRKELDYSPEELQKRLQEYREWVNRLGAKFVSGQRLDRSGAYLKSKDQVVTDGPFLEAKEIIAGYIMINATDLSEAIEITKTLPLLAHFEAMVRPLITTDKNEQ